MAKNIETPADIKIAAMQDRKKAPGYVDLMKPGPGTPWENRGSDGAVGGFIKTVFMSFTQPAWLVDSMRRPETSVDGTIFALLCGAFWSIGSLVQSYVQLHHLEARADSIDLALYWFLHVLRALLMPGVIYLLLTLGSRFYYTIASADMKNKAPPVLAYNIFCYAMGPSILAVIPVFGPLIAAVWIVLLIMYMGKKRLFLGAAASIIATVIATLVCGGILVAVYFIGGFLLSNFNLNPVEVAPTAHEAY